MTSLPTKPPLWLLVSLGFTGTLAMHMYVPVLTFAAADLGVDSASIQLSLTVYILGLGIGQLAYGPISDAIGRRPVVFAGLALFLAGTVACAVATSLPVLIAGRALQSLGGSAGLTLARAIVRDTAGSAGTQKDIALLSMTMLVGPAVSPIIGSVVAVQAGWRGIFVLLGLMALLVGIAAVTLLRETVPVLKPFSLRELLRDFRTLSCNRRFVGIAAGGSIGSTSGYGYLAAAPYILQDELGVSADHVGYFVGGVLVGALTGTLLVRQLSGHVRVDRLLHAGGLVSLAASAAFLTLALTHALSPPTIFVLTFTIMAAAGVTSSAALAAALDASPRLAGSAAGLFGSAQMVSGAICTVLVGLGPRHDLACGLTLTGAGLLSYLLLSIGRRATR